MDKQIKSIYLNKDFKPSDGYNNFCKDNVEIFNKRN